MRKLFALLLLLLPSLAAAQTQSDRIHGRGASTFDQFANTATLTMTGATPSIAGGNVFRTSNGSSTTITNFTNGADSQMITVICGDANTIIQNNANITLAGGVNFSCVLNTAISFVFSSASSVWAQVGGSGSGGGGSPGAPAGSVQCNSGTGAFVACNAVDTSGSGVFAITEDLQVKGPNPAADIRAFGKFAVFSNTTATTNGTNSISLASAQNFKNGEYVTVFNAGAACGLGTPSAPTVTPSVNAGGVNTVVAGAGSSSFAYEIIAADKFGCYTPASASGSTSTGNTLGLSTSTITTMSRATGVVTANTSAAHGLVVGELVHVRYNTTNDGSYEGFWIVASVPSGTQFTFNCPGANSSATGGVIYAFNVNNVTWNAVTGAWKYYVYGRTGGVFALLGVTMSNGWVDYGATMNDSGQVFPTFIPTTAPSSGANDHLTAKITAGGGTTTLTLGTAATASIASSIQSDDGPAIIAAANSVGTGGAVYIPSQGATVNSYTLIPGTRDVKVAGQITANDTIEFGSLDRVEGVAAGSGSSFSWASVPRIVTGGAAHPLANFDSQNYSNLIGYHCTALNGCLGVIAGLNAININFDRTEFLIGNGGTSNYLGLHGIFNTGAFGYHFNHCLFNGDPSSTNDNTNIGSTPVPTFLFTSISGQNTADISVEYSDFALRASFDMDIGAAVSIGRFLARDLLMQSMQMPPFQWTGAIAAGLPLNAEFDSIIAADRGTALIANFSSAGLVGLSLSNITCLTGNHNVLMGGTQGFQGIVSTNVCAAGSANILGLGGQPNGYAVSTDGVIQAPSIGFAMVAPASAPGVAVSSGGSVPIGTQGYTVQFVDANGFFGFVSPSVNASTTSGNQTVTVTRPAAPVGSVAWAPYRNGARIPCGTIPTATTTFVDASFACGQSAFPALATASSVGSGGVSTPNFLLWNNGFVSQSNFPSNLTANQTIGIPNASGTLCLSGGCVVNAITVGGDASFSSSPRSVPPIFFPGALTATWTGASWIIDKAITITRVQSAAKVVPVGCATSAIIRLTDGTTPVNLTINAATNDSGAITQNYAAGATLTVSISTAASGCTTHPGDLNLMIQYRSQ